MTTKKATKKTGVKKVSKPETKLHGANAKAAKTEAKPEPKPEAPKAMAAAAIPHFEEKQKLNFDIDFNSPSDLVPIAKVAWNAVKGHDDAPYEGCLPQFQAKLLEHASSALRTGAQQGDTNLARFEQEVLRLKQEAEGD